MALGQAGAATTKGVVCAGKKRITLVLEAWTEASSVPTGTRVSLGPRPGAALSEKARNSEGAGVLREGAGVMQVDAWACGGKGLAAGTEGRA